ncbi:MAG: hypothetical protein RR827_05700 [Oscillospiraceae bacterium]
MYPIISEKYILSRDSYFGFTLDQNKKELEKNRRGIKMTAYIQLAVGLIFIIATIVTKQSVGVTFMVFAGALVLTGMLSGGKLKGYDKKINESLEKTYTERMYSENLFKVKFYEDKMNYSVGDQTGELFYSDFARDYTGEKYYAIHFNSGEVIIFNKNCAIDKIKNLLLSYKESHPATQETEEKVVWEDVLAESSQETSQEMSQDTEQKNSHEELEKTQGEEYGEQINDAEEA